MFENFNDKDKYRPIPFWSWNDKLDPERLKSQIHKMKEYGMGGFFMHARGGMKTEYLSQDWFECIDACVKEAKEQGLDAWAYDENGWPSGFVGGELLKEDRYREKYLTYTIGCYDENADYTYLVQEEKLLRVYEKMEGEILNVYVKTSVSTVDILNPEVVGEFLRLTHEKYKERYGEVFHEKIKGFFTDEPQYYRWGQPYTPVLKEYFLTHYGQALEEVLGLLFVRKEGYRQFRYRYWKGLQHLMLENFSKRVYEWCDENGVLFTGHYIEESSLSWQMMCCGGIMPYYEFMHVPGIDCLTRRCMSEIPSKQVASAARQLGKKRVLTESFALCGWDVMPKELKGLIEYQYVNGVNLLCHHLFPYSEKGQRKRDYPAHYSQVNPWIEDGFDQFNEYIRDLGCLLGESDEIVDVCMIQPIRSAYFEYQRISNEEGFGVKELEDSFFAQQKQLCEKNIPFHFVDETILEKYGDVKGDAFVCGRCIYHYVILPTMYTMDENTASLLQKYVKNGGKILLMGEKPSFLEGEPYSYGWLKENVTLEDIQNAVPYRLIGRTEDLRSTLRSFKGQDYLYIVNTSWEKEYTFEVCYKVSTAFKRYDLLNDSYQETDGFIRLKPLESVVLIPSEKTLISKGTKKQVLPMGDWRVTNSTPNLFTLDLIRLSYDGVTFEAPRTYMGVFNKLITERFEGFAHLAYDFYLKEIPKTLNLFLENSKYEGISINGKFCSVAVCERRGENVLAADILPYVKIGLNTIVVKQYFFQSEKVRYALFGENVTESLKNSLAYDTEIEAVYLSGDFCVYEKEGFQKGEKPNVWIGKSFYIDKKQDEISCLVTDGYPFFSGHITLKKDLYLKETDVMLRLPGRYHYAKVTVNSKKAGELLFEDCLDISSFTKEGKNEIEVTLTVGNRNLLGPHHFKLDEEPFLVEPNTFELAGSWTDGKSTMERASYSFVDLGFCKD